MAEDPKPLKFVDMVKLTYSEQAQMFLNLFWNDFGDKAKENAEMAWKFVEQFTALDEKNGASGIDLDEFNAHRFLEKQGQKQTVKELRDTLKSIDQDNNNRMAALEYLLFFFKKTVADLESKKQAIPPPELVEAREEMKKVMVDVSKYEDQLKKYEKEIEEAEKDGKQVKANTIKGEHKKLSEAGLDGEVLKRLIKAESMMEKAKKLDFAIPMPGSDWWAARQAAEMDKYKPKGGVKTQNL